MSSPLKSLVNTSVFFTTLRVASPSTGSRLRRLATSFSRCEKRPSVLRVSHTSSHTTDELSASPIPTIRVNDTVKFDIEQNKITDFVRFDTGNIVIITGGRNMGRAGVIVHREKHVGGFDIVHVKDSLDRTFATRYV
jgi:ribosomal protein S4E